MSALFAPIQATYKESLSLKGPAKMKYDKEQTRTAKELTYAEVISYNRKNLEREPQNESRQRNRQQNETEGGRNLYCEFYCKDKRFFV